MGVEPTQDGSTAPQTVLKSVGAPEGSRSQPKRSHQRLQTGVGLAKRPKVTRRQPKSTCHQSVTKHDARSRSALARGPAWH